MKMKVTILLNSSLLLLLFLLYEDVAASSETLGSPTVSEAIPVEGGIPDGAMEDEGRYIVKYKQDSLEYLNRLKTAEANKADGGDRRLRKLTKRTLKLAEFSKANIINFLPKEKAEVIYADTEEEATEWENHKDVEYIERDTKVFMLQTFSDEGEIPYGIKQVQALDVSDEFVDNRKVCVVDSGYDINHADLQTEFVTGTSGGAGNWDEPVNSHGTHCAGTIAAIGNNDGVLGVVRSGKMNLHIVRVFGDDGGWAWSSSLIQAVQACVDAGSNVVSMSLGGGGFSSTSETAYQNMLDNEDVLLIAAAGNSGSAAYSYPASYNAIISVAAVDQFGDKAWFSQYNDQVEIAAPGVAVNSTIVGGGYSFKSGTSMATPHVAGVAALIWSHDPSRSATEVRNALTATARKRAGTSVRDDEYGHGIVQAASAKLYLLSGNTFSPTTSLSPSLSCSDDPEGWYDRDGATFSCEWYASGSNYCANYGDDYANFGTTANEACCVCGGGSRGNSPTKTTPSPSESISTPPSASPTEVCTDSPEDWHDVNGTDFNCDWYSGGVYRCYYFGDEYENDGKTANQACCVCGGGGNEYDLSSSPTKILSEMPSSPPTKILSEMPSDPPTKISSEMPSSPPTKIPSEMPSDPPTNIPSERPSDPPTKVLSESPSDPPTKILSEMPSHPPTQVPSEMPSDPPTKIPSGMPSDPPTKIPSEMPSDPPTQVPYEMPSNSKLPTQVPYAMPSDSKLPTQIPSEKLTLAPNSKLPTQVPSAIVSLAPSILISGSIAPSGCTDDPPNWYDRDGPRFNCDWYAQDNYCDVYGDMYENFGTTANLACCTCQPEPECLDTMEGWYDSYGDTFDCAWYSRHSSFCETYGDAFANFDLTANENCCVCGGGGGE